MRVRVLLFGPLAEAAGTEAVDVDLPDDATVGDVPGAVDGLSAPAASGRSFAYAVNSSYAQPGHALADGDEVALIPPVSGG